MRSQSKKRRTFVRQNPSSSKSDILAMCLRFARLIVISSGDFAVFLGSWLLIPLNHFVAALGVEAD